MGIFGKLAAGKLPVPQQEMYAEYIKGEAYSQPWECCGKDAPVLKAFETALIRILFSNFRYDGLTPAESNMIERNLIMNGRICAVRSNLSVVDQTEDGVFFGRISQSDNTLYDFYGYPKSIVCVGLNGTEIRASGDDFVLGFDTTALERTQAIIPPIWGLVKTFSYRLYNAYSAWMVAMETGKAATIFNAPNERMGRIVKKILEKITANNPYIVLAGENELSNITYEFRGSSDHLKVYYDNYVNTWGAFLELLGQPNAAPNKHERMITGELEMNQSIYKAICNDRLTARRNFCDQVKEKLGKEVRVVNALEEAMGGCAENVSDVGNNPGDDVSAVDGNTRSVSVE